MRVRLSVLPLPASSLGRAARSLPLQIDSGMVTMLNVRAFELPTTPNRFWDNGPFAPLGRIGSYALDYGDGTSGGKGVTEVWTSVDKYKTSADARQGLAFWRLWDRRFDPFLRTEFSISAKKVKAAAALGSRRFAVLVSYRAVNLAPLYGLDEQFTVGHYEGDVTVWAGTAATARKLAPRLAERLEARIKQARAGRLHAKPVKLPTKPKAGPAPGGPDLAPLALQPTDLSGPATGGGNYLPAFGVSFYDEGMSPAGQFSSLGQEIFWYPTANEASFYDDDLLPPGDDLGLSSVGDGARGVLLNGLGPDGENEALVLFCSGQLFELLSVTSTDAIQPSQVKNIAQTVANKINAAGLGS